MSTVALASDRLHLLRLAALAASVLLVVLYITWVGYAYYRLPLTERVYHPQHAELRPAGLVGIRLGFLSGLVFFGLFLYPLRKRWPWLGRIGKTRHWLDIHILLGLSAPVLVTLHSSFKLRGIAGMAYWIMIAIVISGIIGRYLYSQIPRTMSAAEMSLADLQKATEELGAELERQQTVPTAAWRALLAVPGRREVDAMPLWRALVSMLWLDVKRPLRVARLRRHRLAPGSRLLTLGGWLPSGNKELERVIGLARRQSWLTAKISFLARARDVFRLWHVVHRPFSYSFAILVAAHIAVVAVMGFI